MRFNPHCSSRLPRMEVTSTILRFFREAYIRQLAKANGVGFLGLTTTLFALAQSGDICVTVRR